jgi:hypothetical protein
MQEKIRYILEALDVNNPSAASYRATLLKILQDSLALINFADNLKQEVQFTKDISDDRIQFYDFYLAVAWQKTNVGLAKEKLSNAVHDFRIRDMALNEAMGEWLFSIIHYENKKYERAQRACETAISVLQQLITRCEEESRYEKARELKKHFSALMAFQESIKEKPSSGTFDSSDKAFTSNDETTIKSRLQYFHYELNKTYDLLREQKMRVPPTLVAARFYIYKLLAPSHSVYSKVPPAENEREKEIYDDLIKKVGFFEVIEQLVELEREFTPTASREEILKKINFEWDQEISQ